MNIRLTAAQKIKISNTDHVFQIMQKVLLRENFIGRTQEHFWVMGLNEKYKILFIELMALGSGNMLILEPRKTLKTAVTKDAKYCILIHNHPSKKLLPSRADMEMTGRLIMAGYILGVEVIDHLIISEDAYFSYDEKGIMNDLRTQTHMPAQKGLQSKKKKP